MNRHARRGFTLVDLVIALAVLALLLILVVPLLAATRGLAGQTGSADNLRTIGAAHFTYATDWNGRQLTYVVDDVSVYGGPSSWWFTYAQVHGEAHPPITLGWGAWEGEEYRCFRYETGQNPANASLVLPINMDTIVAYFGSFRFPNAAQFNEYLSGRFYDEVFYAPADEVVRDTVGDRFDDPAEYVPIPACPGLGSIPVWSSYCMSPAAMFDSKVMRHDDPDDPDANGFVRPWDLPDGFTSPSYFAATYSALKTHVLEHHWLQSAPDPCNPQFSGCYENGCEPYYFNMGRGSAPVTLFYDGHVNGVLVEQAMADDAIVREQMNPNWGLWSQDTPWGSDGYLSEYSRDDAQTSFHILTTDGIEGRDVLSGSAAPRRPPVGRARPGQQAMRRAAPPGMGKITYEP